MIIFKKLLILPTDPQEGIDIFYGFLVSTDFLVDGFEAVNQAVSYCNALCDYLQHLLAWFTRDLWSQMADKQ